MDIRTEKKKERIQHRLESINKNELDKGNGSSLQSATTSCRLQRQQNFKMNSQHICSLTTNKSSYLRL